MKSTQKLRRGPLVVPLLLACTSLVHAQTALTVTPAIGTTSGRQGKVSNRKDSFNGAVTGITVRLPVTPLGLERLQFVTGLEYIQKPTPAQSRVWYSSWVPGQSRPDSVQVTEERRERYTYVQVPIALQWRVLSWKEGRWSLYGLAGTSWAYGIERVFVQDGAASTILTARTKAGKVDGLRRFDVAGLLGLRVTRRLGPGSLGYEMRYAHSLLPTEKGRGSLRTTAHLVGYTFDWPSAKH